jgi:hypothetical protein
MRDRIAGVLAAAGFLLVTVPGMAHHATQAQYDKDNQKTLVGVMKSVQWINPHVRWYLDVKDEKGEVTTWIVSGSGPGAYRTNGITAAGVFPVGKEYKALVALARDGTASGYILTWTLPDGKTIDFWHEYNTNQ